MGVCSQFCCRVFGQLPRRFWVAEGSAVQAVQVTSTPQYAGCRVLRYLGTQVPLRLVCLVCLMESSRSHRILRKYLGTYSRHLTILYSAMPIRGKPTVQYDTVPPPPPACLSVSSQICTWCLRVTQHRGSASRELHQLTRIRIGSRRLTYGGCQ